VLEVMATQSFFVVVVVLEVPGQNISYVLEVPGPKNVFVLEVSESNIRLFVLEVRGPNIFIARNCKSRHKIPTDLRMLPRLKFYE
jgi:hypothetical protein